MSFKLLPTDPEIGWTPFAWLIYLFPVFFFLRYDSSTPTVALAVAVTAVFLVIYFRVYWERGRRQLYAIMAIAALAILYTPINPGASTFYVFTGAFLGMCLARRTAVFGIAVMLVALAVEVFWFNLHPGSWIPAAVFTPVIGGLNSHFRERSRINARLRLAQEEVERLAKLDERERIARDLHDLLGHTLSVVTLKSELVGRLLPKLEEAENACAGETLPSKTMDQLRTEIHDIESLSRRAMNEVRNSVKGYQAHRMQTELAKARMALTAAQIHFELQPGPYDLGIEQETVVAHALREAVTNVTRHSRALLCTIRIRTFTNGDFVLQVEDDGRGVRHGPGSGLTGMKERVTQIGGTVELATVTPRSLLGKGTLLTVTVPKRSPLGHELAERVS